MGKFSKTHRRTKKRGGMFQDATARVEGRFNEDTRRKIYADEIDDDLDKRTNKVDDPRWQGEQGMQFKNLGMFGNAASRLIEGMPDDEFEGKKGDRITVKLNKKPTTLLKNSEGKWIEIGPAIWNRIKKEYQGGSPLTQGGKRRKTRRNQKKKSKKTHHKKPKKSRRKKHNTRRKRRH